MRGRFIFSAILLMVLFSCKKESPANLPIGVSHNYPVSGGASYSPGGPFSFTKLEASPATISKGSVSKISAYATGTNLTFNWSTPHGDIFGTGPSVYYSDSCVGTYSVTCTVKDGTNSVTLTVTITITD